MQHAARHVDLDPGVPGELERGLVHAALAGQGEPEVARGGGVIACAPGEPVEREPVAALAVAQPVRDPGDGRGGAVHRLGDLRVGHALVEQRRRLPAVGDHLELVQRADVAQERGCLVRRAQREQGVAEVVDGGGAPGSAGSERGLGADGVIALSF